MQHRRPTLREKKRESRFWLQKELMPKQACVLWIRAVGSFILAPFLRMLCDITHTGLLFPLCSNTLAQFQRASSGNRPSLQPTRGPCHLTSGNVLLREKASARLLSRVALPHPAPALGLLPHWPSLDSAWFGQVVCWLAVSGACVPIKG